MNLSIFDLFKIGIGPSSSHTMGPMTASYNFIDYCNENGLLEQINNIQVKLHGSLAWTGKGHGTDRAIILGLSGFTPQSISNNDMDNINNIVHENNFVEFKSKKINFNPISDIIFEYDKLFDFHSNAIEFSIFSDKKLILSKLYYSIGGGFVIADDAISNNSSIDYNVKFEFKSGKDLLFISENEKISISRLIYENENSISPNLNISKELLKIWKTMNECIKRGVNSNTNLPGKLKVTRRAPQLYELLLKEDESNPLNIMDWVNVWAIAVNEENARGGKIVTAPTNGAAGIIPAVIKYYTEFIDRNNQSGIENFLLTAGAIGLLYKSNASISGAEVGCQGEVGVACSMAAGGLVSAMGGSSRQIENAAEIGMEHNLGLTCDPIGGLVQIPCIERNAMGAVKAINAARMALKGNGEHLVSLDQVIKTMFETGKDMQSKYKETSLGGLAVNVVEC